MLSLQALLCSPEPDDPQDAQVAQMYLNNKDEFIKTAKFWTESYAKATSKDEMVLRICEMGFAAADARKALESNAWDEQAAVNSLLGM